MNAIHLAAHVFVLCTVAFVYGCGGSRGAAEQPSPTTTTVTTAPASDEVSTGVTPPPGSTLGERLGQLDARLRVAPADSLPALRAEYQRLLALRNGDRVVDTFESIDASSPISASTAGASTGSTPFPMSAPMGDSAERRRRLSEGQQHSWGGAETEHLSDVPPASATTATAPRSVDAMPSSSPERVTGNSAPTTESSIANEESPRPDADNSETAAATPRDDSSPRASATKRRLRQPPVTPSNDPSRIFKGLRPREVATIPGHERSLEAASSTKRANARRAARTAAARGRDEQRRVETQSRAHTIAPTTRAAATINSRGQRKALVSGIAAARAGKYADAVEMLTPSVSSGRADADARYYFALALEKTGQTARATDEYLRASRGRGDIAERSYVDYCRLIAHSGNRDKARQLLTQFIRRNGDGSQAVAARRLLQSL